MDGLLLNARIEALNAAIAEELAVLAAAGRHVAVVDMYTPSVETPDYESAMPSERLHPNDAGYAVMAGLVRGHPGAPIERDGCLAVTWIAAGGSGPR